jgi:hypothetical protein
MDDFLVNFATVLMETGRTSLRFQLDNGQILTPINPEMYSGGENGQRVIINYTPLEDNKIRIRAVSNIFTGTVFSTEYPEQLTQNPVRIQSVWVGGNYLNVILEIQFHSVSHSIALFRDTTSTSTVLHLSYNRNNDPPGTSRLLHASFSLNSLRGEADSVVPFRLFINTHSGMREFEMVLR